MSSKLLLVDDEPGVQYSFARVFDSSVELVTASNGQEALNLIPSIRPDLVLMDVGMAGVNGLETLRRIRQFDANVMVILMTAYGSAQTAIEAMKIGAYDLLLKPFDIPKLKETVNQALLAASAIRRIEPRGQAPSSNGFEHPLVGRTEAMQSVFKLIGQVAKSDATVLITGESGTGKELVAQAIYEHGRRSAHPFLAVNCAAIPEPLLESELFGHEQGAFTGAAKQRLGKFEQCHQGTLFLDEIGDMAPTTQTKILRVLQSGTFERVGGNEPIQVDVRIVAATNKSLEQAVSAGQFREELFYRLNVVRMHIPPLRERQEDIPLLVEHFFKKLAQQRQRSPKAVTPEAMEALRTYHWPGNVRELENAIHRAMVLSKREVILVNDLPREITEAGRPASTNSLELAKLSCAQTPDVMSLARQLFVWAKSQTDFGVISAVHRGLIFQALEETGGNQVQAARLLGITRSTLRSRMKTFGAIGAVLPFSSARNCLELVPA